MQYIDLRSDTVTQPTHEMRQAMSSAIVGDDVYREDPTVVALEQRVAHLFGKEAALFFPSGTMSNLCALLSWCPHRGTEYIVGENSHIYLYEQAGAAQFGSLSPRVIPMSSSGIFDIDFIVSAIRENDIHEPITGLLCLENTHNGNVLPLSYLAQVHHIMSEKGIPIHMDGARIWNACVSLRVSPSSIAQNVDSLTVCLSKGLGAPVGSLLVGPTALIDKARRLRKALGGGMRQVGVLAAAGLIALDDFEFNSVLQRDHEKTVRLAKAVSDISTFSIVGNVHTNMVFVYTNNLEAQDIARELRENNILVSVWGPRLLRFVVHRDISSDKIEEVIDILKRLYH